MSEQLAQLEKKGGGGKLSLTVKAFGAASGDKYARYDIPNTHPFKKIKVISYVNVTSSSTPSGYPYINVNGTQYKRPAVGTEYDISNKPIFVVAIASIGSYSEVGIEVELS